MRTPKETSAVIAKTIEDIREALNVAPSTVMSGYSFCNFHNKKEFRTIHVDKLIKGICKDNKVSEKHIRKIMGLRT